MVIDFADNIVLVCNIKLVCGLMNLVIVFGIGLIVRVLLFELMIFGDLELVLLNLFIELLLVVLVGLMLVGFFFAVIFIVDF